ncbi:MAG: L-histidine N(alpha)-methyltransferase [Myxococcota bacterium]
MNQQTSAGDVVNDGRLRVVSLASTGARSTLAADVRAGLEAAPRSLPPKHFYDARGAELFDAICDTPEYYPTRTEEGLLAAVASRVVARAGATDLVELGSGAARKTRLLLEAMLDAGPARYVPVDVAREMLVASARTLLADYPRLTVHGLVADYDQPFLEALPPGESGGRLIAFLGSTIGNFTHDEGAAFLGRIAEQMEGGDRFLLGLDLVKDPAVLHAAYNDAAGLTAAFNRNVLDVVNRELEAEFPTEAFEHVAFYDTEKARIEMHLEASRAMRVHIGELDLDVELEAGERIHTEISRKFTPEAAERLLSDAGLVLDEWWTDPKGWFALALARLPRE